MSSSNPEGASNTPHLPRGYDPRVDELLRRVAALERALATGAAAPVVAPPIAPPIAPPVAEPNTAFIERLADLKRDVRAARVADAPPVEPAGEAVSPHAGSAFETGEFEAIVSEVAPPGAPVAPPIAPPTVSSVAPPIATASVPPIAPPSSPPIARAAVPPPLARPMPAPKPGKPKPVMSLESFIGFKGFMFAGSIILIIGVIMGLKFGIDQGWFRMPPALRCIAAAGFGALLLGAGEWARRKINALASAGLSAAGIATMYGAAWAAFGLFKIVDAPVGFFLLVAAAGIGVFVALRGGLVSIAIVSLLGAYLAPLIARSGNSPAIVMPAYLFAILALGLVLAARRPKPFRLLRGVVWWGTVLLGTWSVFHAADVGQPIIGLGFLGLVWGAVHAELWYGARKAPEATGSVGVKGITWRAARPVLSTFATTMWCSAIGVWSLKVATGGLMPADWMVTGAFAVAAGVASMILAGNLRVLIDTPENDGERLGAALMAQAGALIVATVVLGLAGRAEVVAGILIGVAAVLAGRWIKSRAVDVYGLIVLALTVGRMVVYDSWAGGITGPATLGSMALGFSLSEWTLLMCCAAAGWAASGVLLVRSQSTGRWRSLGVTAIGVSLAIAFVSILSPYSEPVSVMALLMLVGLAALGIGRVLRSRGMDIYAMAVLAGAVAELLLFETQPFRDLSPVHPGRVILGISLTKWTGLMLGAAASWAVVGLTLMRSDRGDGPWRRMGVACVGGALCVAFAGFVSPNAAAVSLLVFGILFCVAGFGVGNALRSPVVSGLSVAALGVASLIAGVFQFSRPENLNVWAWHAGGLVLSRWGMAMMLGALVWAGFAFVLRRVWAAGNDFFRDLSVLAAVVAVLMLFAAALAPGAEHGPVVWAWLALSILVFVVHRFVPRMYLDLVAFAGLAAATGLWTITYAFSDWSASTRPICLHPGLIQGLALALAFWGGAGFLWKRAGRRGGPTVPDMLRYAVAMAVVLIFASSSLEVRRAALMFVENDNGQRAALSIWWGIFGLALIGSGFWRGVSIVRHSGLALMTVAVGKAIIFDLASVPAGWRVVSFLGLGLMMLGVAIGYAKAHATLEKTARAQEPQPDVEEHEAHPES